MAHGTWLKFLASLAGVLWIGSRYLLILILIPLSPYSLLSH